MDLKQLRAQIDHLDEEILSLLNRRMEVTLCTRKLKPAVAEPQREQEILERIRARSQRLISPDFSEKLFRDIIGESKRLQSEQLQLIAFQGEHGAFSEFAARTVFPTAVPIPLTDFRGVFESVQSGVADYGVVPVENSVAGNVIEVDDLLINSELFVVGEATCAVSHCLMALPGTDHRDIRTVYSHPQALAQCRRFLERNKLEARPYFNTAGAALMLAKERPPATAVLASQLSAEIYGLEILKDDVQDSNENRTRFLILAKEAASGTGSKCTVIFTARHKPGALFQILRAFSETGINLTRIESRPATRSAGDVSFLLDFEGDSEEQRVKNALDLLRAEALHVRVIGCYSDLSPKSERS